MFCEYCEKEFNDRAIATHLRLKHNIFLQDYYDLKFKKENEGVCVCGKQTPFLNTHGYQRFCSIRCAANSEEVKNKTIKFNLQKYGVKHTSQSSIVKDRIKNSNLEKYGCEYSFQAEEVKAKIKKTMSEEKRREACKKAKKTKLERYGDANFKNEEKIKKTKLERYGDAGFVNPAKAKKTNEKKYGGHPSRTKEVQDKRAQSCMRRFGTKFPLQNHEILCKARKKYEFNGVRFDSKPEIEWYQKLKEYFTDFEYQPGIAFEYEFDGKTHIYFPDFKVGNVIYELKGAHFFKDGQMIKPFNRSENGLYEAKHKCMIKNGVRIIFV